MAISLGDSFRQWSEARRYGGDQEQSAQRLLEGAYAVSRNIGDGALARSNRESGALLAAVGSSFDLQITPGSAGLTESESAGVASRTHRDGINRADRMIVDLEAIYDNQSPIIQNKLKSQGLDMPHETVAYLVTLRTVAHESAHVIQGGIGKMVNLEGGPAVDYMSSLFAESSGTDADVLNEAFAEGYAELVLEKTLVELGYGKDDIDTIVHSMSHRDSQANVSRGYLALPQSDMEIMMEHTSQQIKARKGLL